MSGVVIGIFKGILDVSLWVGESLLIGVGWVLAQSFGIFIYLAKEMVGEFYGYSGKYKTTFFGEILFYLTCVAENTINTIKQLIRPLLLFLAIIFINILSFISLYLWFIFFWIPIYYFLINVIYVLNVFLTITLQVVTPLLNVASQIVYDYAPIWNDTWMLIYNIIKELVSSVCQYGPNNPTNTCVPFKLLLDFLWTEFGVIKLVLIQLWLMLKNLVGIVSDTLCPNGVCDPVFCEIIVGLKTCSLGPQLIIGFIQNVITFLIRYVLPVIQIIIYFILDFVIFGLGLVFGVIQSIVGGDPLSVLINQQLQSGGGSLLKTILPQTQFIAALIGIENFLLGSAKTFVDVARNMLILVDLLVCNLILSPGTCLFPKICYALLRPFKIEIVGIIITIDLSKLICYDTLRYRLGACECDKCISTAPFAVVFQLLGLLVYTGGNFMVPCNGSASCVGCLKTNRYSILVYILPILL